ncbi:MAG: PAS domain S-box protein [Chloroflexi bacterium]|nr:PAS domain S-box protein [Chloroflexota bacterium]
MLKLFRENLRFRLWIAFIVVLLVPTVSLTYYHTREFSGALREEVRLKQSRILETETSDIEASLNQANADILFLSQSIEIRRYANALPEDQPAKLEDTERLLNLFLLRYSQNYEGVCLLDTIGYEVLCINNETPNIRTVPSEELQDQSTSSYFKGAIRMTDISSGQPPVFVSEVEPHLHPKNIPTELVLHYATRLQSDTGHLAGVVVLDFRLAPLIQLVLSENTTETTYLLDADGNYIYHPNPDYVLGSTSAHNLRETSPDQAAALLDHTSGVLFGIPDAPNDLFSFQEIAAGPQLQPLTLIHQQPLPSVMQPIEQAWWVSAAIAGILVVLTSLFALWVTSRITRPIYNLTRKVAALQTDIWSVAIAPPAHLDEVGLLTLAFIKMRDRIRNLIDNLEERIQHLETVESARAHSEQKYRSFIEQAFEGIRLVDKNGIIQEWNPTSEQITGIPATEAIGKPLAEIQTRLIPEDTRTPDTVAQIHKSLDRFFPANEVQPPQHIPARRIQRPDGTIGYIENLIFPIVTGNQVYYGGIIRDITAQKEDQARLEQHVRKLESLQRIAIAVGGSIKLDEVLDILLDQLANLIPYDRASIMLMKDGRLTFTKWRGFTEDMVLTEIEASISPQEYMVNQGQPVIVDDTQTNPSWRILSSGDELIHSWMGIPMIHRDILVGVLNLDHHTPRFFTDDQAQLAYAVAHQAGIAIATAQLLEDLEGLVRTRTQELQMEQERSDIILRNITDAIVFTDGDGFILYVNNAWEKLNGYTLAEAHGKRSNLVQSGETPFNVYQSMWATINSGKMWKGDLKNRRKDGSTYVCELTIAPVHSGDGVIQYYVGVQRDVTAVRELDALKERFVADAAHDLGNPVAVLNTTLYLLRLAPSQLDQRLPVLEYQVQRLEALVKDLLTISHLDREQQQVETAPIQLPYLVRQIVDGQQTLAAQKEIHLTSDLQNTPPLMGDVKAIERVVVNLVANALTYTPANGTVHIVVSQADDEIMLSVQDTGMGIASGELTRIFDRFYRTDTARKKTAGTGLGLPIVKKIVELHGGRIEVTSEVDKGSEFRVYFPVRP